MEHYWRLQPIVLEQLERIHTPALRRQGIIHTLGVVDAISLIAAKRGLDMDTCRCTALLHDIAQYTLNCAHREHAAKGAQLAAALLEKQSVTKEKSMTICHAIARHSEKQRVHDAYSEALKDADVFAHWLQEDQTPVEEISRRRLILLQKELNIN